MNLNELREHIANVKDMRKKFIDITSVYAPSIDELLALAQQVLDVKGFPENQLTYEHRTVQIGNQVLKETDNRYNAGFNDCLADCKLAHTKVVMEKDREIAELKKGLEDIK